MTRRLIRCLFRRTFKDYLMRRPKSLRVRGMALQLRFFIHLVAYVLRSE